MNPSDIILLRRASTMMKVSSSGDRRAARTLSQVRTDAVSKLKGSPMSAVSNPDDSVLFSGQEESLPQLLEIYENASYMLTRMIDDSFTKESM